MPSILSTLLTSILAVTTAAPLATATPIDTRAAAGKYDPAVSLATFSDTNCYQGQQDVSQPDGVCYDLPGQGMKIWWLAPGCRVLVGDCFNSVDPEWREVDINYCIPVGDKYHYQVYC
ncbi:hypothetical protein B0T22DRAFT_515996 [Podospora appendiculata]|uniref:Uncharacterized protein n=1 Tax=Podospora appendiculata TaxID=314037 RepID=A0AAE0XDJ7_9PEZI|nr:hypothetical protein B0T22DRAFT_515996 [Podospora appendiculata]